MHESSVTDAMLALALEKAGEAGAKKITRINLILGELSGIVPECVQFYFNMISRATIAKGAKIDLDLRPTRIRCRKCGHEYNPVDRDWTCPKCQELNTEIISGREFHLGSIEVA
jgi:hydrogenase nickel incorporation protein HypA/HybF